MAIAIMISTFGCVNGLVLAGPRAYYAMAKDGLFFQRAGMLNRAHVPGWSLVVQGIWQRCWCCRALTTPDTQYGNLYSDLLDYVISAALIFYILTIAGVFRLRHTRPDAERPYRAFGYPFVPALYIAGRIGGSDHAVRLPPSTTWPGLVIVVTGAPVYAVIRRKA